MKPFLKWPGGKRKLLPIIRQNLPGYYTRYFEPFLGGGALFFDLLPECDAYLSDANDKLIYTYQYLRNSPDELIVKLQKLESDFLSRGPIARREFYDTAKRSMNSPAHFIFANKTCFNGLYRENRKGEYNVPYGYVDGRIICDAATLHACSQALSKSIIHDRKFEDESKIKVKRNDFVYLDPPYLPISSTSNFSRYYKSGFGLCEHRKLADWIDVATARGAHILLSMADTSWARDRYRYYNIVEVSARRMIGAGNAVKPRVTELLIRSY